MASSSAAAMQTRSAAGLRASGARPALPLRPRLLNRLVSRVAAPEREEVATHAPLLLDFEERPHAVPVDIEPPSTSAQLAAERRKAEKQRAATSYQASAIAATIGVTGIAVLATYLRFDWHLRDDGVMPWGELLATLALVGGGVFGMEMWARYAHKDLWHDFEPGWALHKSHHMPRTGPFEANDVFAIINGVPAMALCLYGFLTPGITGGLAFGAGMGITLFGIMYMFVHDGLVHKRFPVGPIAELPYMKRVLAAHQLHHSNKFKGVPWGLFLGPQELYAVPGGREELDRLVAAMDAASAASAAAQAAAALAPEGKWKGMPEHQQQHSGKKL